MSTTATRRSTRRTAAATASTEILHTVSEHGTPPAEAPQRKGRKSKVPTVKAEPQVATESQQTVTKTRATSRANATSATSTATSTNTSSTMTAQAPAVPRKLTRASRAEIEKAGGQASPQRSLEDARPAKRARSTAPAKTTSQKRRAVTTKSAPKEAANNQENEDDLPPFFTTRKPHFSSLLLQPPSTETPQQENDRLRVEIDKLRVRVTDLESQNQDLLQKLHERDQQLLAHGSKIMRLENENFRLQQLSDVGNDPPADQSDSVFDDDIFDAPQSTPAQPVFINGTESAFALLHKIEQNARETKVVEPCVDKNERPSESNGTKELLPAQSAKRTFTEVSATPTRPVEKTNILSRSFSAIKSRFFSTPKPQPTPEVITPTPTKSLPPQNTLTETLSLPPTPVGERVKTPKKKRTPTNIMMKVLLKGSDEEDRRKAENWAKQVIPELKNDPAFREKRKRLETPVLFKDLNSYPSAKPWETGFGDPLGDLDDDDIVPVWAVYLELKAEEEEHAAKRHKSNASVTNQVVPTIDEQFAASTSARMSPKLYNSNGHSASLHDFRPRRSVEPSPMFSNSVSHTQGSNIFSELQGHDAAAQIHENDREILKNATKATVDTQAKSSVGVTFSVPDDSDDEDSTVDAETATTGTSGTEAAPVWTQPPPPAPVPAHAPLPGGPATDTPLSPPSQQPVAEIERQRQRLMKHTPAKPSRLREAIYPSPSVLSDIGNESLLAATPAPVTASDASMFGDIPGAELIELDAEEQAALEELMNSEEYKQKLAVEWARPIITYESDEEELSPSST